MYLVDTDRIIDYLHGRPEAVTLLDSLASEGRAISLVTYGEIYEGIYYGPNPSRHEAEFQEFLRGYVIHALNEPIMRRFARIRGDLRRQGLLIRDPDLLIAATAIEHGLALATRNVRHFERIPGLLVHSPG